MTALDLLPQGVDLERAVVGAALHGPKAVEECDQVQPRHFQDPRNAALWQLTQDMIQAGEPVSPVTVAANLKRLPGVKVDALYVADCYSTCQIPAQAPTLGRALVNAAQLNALQSALIRAGQLLEGASDAQIAAEDIRQVLEAAQPDGHVEGWIGDHLDETVASFSRPSVYFETPWRDLNGLIAGWRPGGLYVVGARPASGKSILAIQAARAMANIGPVALSTLEMGRHEVNQRLLAATAGVHQGKLKGTSARFAGLSADEHRRIDAARRALAGLPLSVDDRAGVTVNDIRAHARRVARRGPLAGIVVDYLQLLSNQPGDRRPRHEIVADWSRQLKILAKEFNCPVIALSQLNRASESRESRAPSMADLRESGALEQDADVVLLLHQPTEDVEGQQRVVDDRLVVTVAKNRQGPVGRAILERDGAHARLLDLTGTTLEKPM